MCCCSDCKYWQGHKGWGDCYRVLAYLEPEIMDCTNDFGNSFTIPFDPNDAREYWHHDERFHRCYKEARSMLPRGVRIKKYKGNYFFQTNESFSCGGCSE